MMLSSNYNGSFQFQPKLNQEFSTSVDSTSGGSIGANSLLTEANTLIFNSPTTSQLQQQQQNSSFNLSSSYIKSPFVTQHLISNNKSLSQSPKQQKLSTSGSFSRQLFQLQQSQQPTDLDFDLHYNIQHAGATKFKTNDLSDLSLIVSNNNKNTCSIQNQTKKTKNNTNLGDFLFNDDDEDQIDLDDDNHNFDDDDLEDESSLSNGEMFQFKSQIETTKTNITIAKILDNPIGYNSSANRFIPTTTDSKSFNNNNSNNNDNLVNSIKKVNFLDETSPINSLSSYAGASITPTSNFNDSTPQNSVTTKHSTTSRTLMKLQLMKQQAEQNEKKAAAASVTQIKSNQQNNNILISSSNEMSSTITSDSLMPSSFTSSEIIPRNHLPQVFQTETKLEYPTKYHVMQIAKNLQQSVGSPMSPSTPVSKSQQKCNKSYAPQQQQRHQRKPSNPSSNNSYRDASTSLASSGDIAVLPNSSSSYIDCAFNEKSSQHSFDSHSNSNLELNLISSPTSSSFSQADYIDEIDDLVLDDLNSFTTNNKRSLSTNLTNLEIQEEINRIEECLNLPKTLPSDYNFNLMSPSMTQSPVRPSTSCPTDIARIKKLKGLNLTEDDIRLIVKDRQKKDNHNMIERRRRFNINDRIKELGSILPKSNQGEIKQNKGSILKASVDYIKNLQLEVSRTKELGDKFNQMTLLNRQLVNRIKELESQTIQPSIITNIKQEPVVSLPTSLFNLVTENSNKTNLGLNNSYDNLSKSSTNNIKNSNFYLTSEQFNEHNNLDLLLNNTSDYSNNNNTNNNLFTNDTHMVHDSEVLLNDSLLDELFKSPIKNHYHDPLLSNTFNDKLLMDTLNNA